MDKTKEKEEFYQFSLRPSSVPSGGAPTPSSGAPSAAPFKRVEKLSSSKGVVVGPSRVRNRLENLEVTSKDLLQALRIDRLRVGLHGVWKSDEAWRQVNELAGQVYAGQLREHSLCGSTFKLWTETARPRYYRLALTSTNRTGVEVLVLPFGDDNAPILVQLTGAWHLAYTLADTEGFVRDLAHELGFAVDKITLHALDICADLPEAFKRHNARHLRGTFRRGGKHKVEIFEAEATGDFTGFRSSKLSQKERGFCFYDKLLEADDYLRRLWKRASVSPDSPIWRVELKLDKRRHLQERGVSGFSDLTPERLREIWEWFTAEYLTVANRKGQVTRRWQRVQKISRVYSRNENLLAPPQVFKPLEDEARRRVYARVPTFKQGPEEPKTRREEFELEDPRVTYRSLFSEPALKAGSGTSGSINWKREREKRQQAEAAQKAQLVKSAIEWAEINKQDNRPPKQLEGSRFTLFVPAVSDMGNPALIDESDFARALYSLCRHHYPVRISSQAGVSYKGIVAVGWGSGSISCEVKRHAGRLMLLDQAERNAQRHGESVQRFFDEWEADTAFYLAWARYVAAYAPDTAGLTGKALDIFKPLPFKLHHLTFLNRGAAEQRLLHWHKWYQEGPYSSNSSVLRRDLQALYKLSGASCEQVATEEAQRRAAAA